MQRKVTNIREVATAAGVSRSTVSLVLNDSTLVKKETRERVLEVIQQLGYVPNDNARSLSNRKMNSLGVVILSEHERSRSYDFQYATGLYSASVLNGISAGLSDTDYNLVIEYYTQESAAGELPKVVCKRRVDGVFVVGSPYNREFIAKMKAADIPFVTIGIGMKEEENDSVWADPGKGVYLGFKHMLEMGHTRIAYLNCPKRFSSNYFRAKGIEKNAQELGLEFNYDWLINCHSNNGEGGYQAMKKLWESGARPSGVIGANAAIAVGAMRYLFEQSVYVPKDISFMVYEDNVLCGYMVPALTAVNIQKECMGEKAVEMMLERLASPDKPYMSTEVLPYLVERGSIRKL